MEDSMEQIVDGLIKEYKTDLRSEAKFRQQLQNLDWDAEEKLAKRYYKVSRNNMLVTLICFLLVSSTHISFGYWYLMSKSSLILFMLVTAIALLNSIIFLNRIDRFNAFLKLRKLLES